MNDLPEKRDASAAAGAAPDTFAFDPGGLTGDGLTYAILSQPSEGWAINNHDGSFFFDPVMDFRKLGVAEVRRVSFTYQVSDGQGTTQTATATLVVTGRSGAPPLVELSGDVVVGDTPAPEPQPIPPREPGFSAATAKDTSVPGESLPGTTGGAADDAGAIELVDIEPPSETAPETPLEMGPDPWPSGMAVEEQQRRVENSLTEDARVPGPATVPETQDNAAETAVPDAPGTFAQDSADESASQDAAAELSAGSDQAFGESGSLDDRMQSDFAVDRIGDSALADMAEDGLDTDTVPAPAFGEGDDGAADWAADKALCESAQPPADLSEDESPAAPAPPETLGPMAGDGYSNDQFLLSAAGEAGLQSVAATGQDETFADSPPALRDDSAIGDMANAEPAASIMLEPAPAATGAAAPDNGLGSEDIGPKCFDFANATASGQLDYRILSQPIEGRIEDRGDGTFTFEPGPPLLDMAIGEMCQVDFTYQVEIDGRDAECTKATVTVIGTSDGPEPSAVSFGPGETPDPLDSAPAAADFAAAPEHSDSGFEAYDTALPIGPADLGAAPEAADAGGGEPAMPLPLGPADDRLEVAPGPIATVDDGDLSHEMPPGTEPWPTLDPAIEAAVRKSHEHETGVSSSHAPASPVAQLAAEHGTDVPDSIPAFLAGEPEPQVTDDPAPGDSPSAEQSGFGAQDAVGDEMPSVEQSHAEGDAASIELGVAMDRLAAEPEAFERADPIEDEAMMPTVAEETVAYIEESAADFLSPTKAPADENGPPLGARDDALDEPAAADLDAEIDLAAAYLRAQGAELSAPVAEVPPVQNSGLPAAGQSTFDQEPGNGDAGDALQVFDGHSPFEKQPEKPAPPAESEGPAGQDLLPGVTATDVLKSVVGGREGDAEGAVDELEEGERIDTLHVDGVSGGPGVGGWDLELTEGSIVETHNDQMLLSSEAAGAVVLDGNVGRIKFEGIERIVW